MVDAAAPLAGKLVGATPEMTGRNGAATSVAVGAGETLETYVEAAADGLYSPAQSPLWIGSWLAEKRADVVVATIRRDGRSILSVALEVDSRGPVRTASFMGGRHANGNFVPVSRADARSISIDDISLLINAIHKTRPDIDLIAFERLATDIAGIPNPLLLLPSQHSPNLSLAVDLAGGFDALLARASGKRKRKKHRSQVRKFEAVGGFRRLEARTATEVDDFLAAFFALKAVRFGKMGIADVFAEPEVQSFFRAIFTKSLSSPKPSFVLHALEVGGSIRAVTGSSRCHDRLICEFGAIAEDDLAFASPGEFLFFDNIEEACKEGLAVYDFSVGDEPYKRLWCDLEIRQFDVLVPLTLKGWAAASVIRLKTRAKAFVKNNRLVWTFVKTFRKKTATQAEPADD
jgi:CelD/BcsL family acetyltransferase involved in cellulose biosynthesis